MTFQMTALYHQPVDKAAFDRHYDEVHGPLTLALPGIRSLHVQRPGAGADGAQPTYHLIATLTFDSEAAMATAVGGAEGEAALADLPNFAGAGVAILSGPVDKRL